MPANPMPHRADHIGSLLRPSKLLEMRYNGGCSSAADALRLLEDECIREVVAMQEEIGLQVISDGEFRRESWRSSFTGRVEGLANRKAQAMVNKRGYVDMGPFVMDAAPFVEGKIRRSAGIVTEEFSYLRSLTLRTPKIALPAPSFLHFFAGEDAVDRSVYPSIEAFHADLTQLYIDEIADLAALGATYIQLDEAPLGFLSDAATRKRMDQAGLNPNDWIDLYVELINTVTARAPAGVNIGIHICRGNSMGISGGSGSFEPVAARVFKKMNAPILLLEFDEPDHSDLSPLRYIRDDQMVVLGLISSKLRELEEAAHIKTRIHQAAEYVPLDRLCISPQCGFSSRDKGTRLTLQDQTAKLQLLVSVAEDVWN
jgi:5-methyltetrahydropteroyltriglutamate--homocysteine methyltransferase